MAEQVDVFVGDVCCLGEYFENFALTSRDIMSITVSSSIF